ncbi:uncharacterized protein BDV14DRAFT_49726 [Aspergillus stella-maris]|uniref:uncharacterized protein n=1 Tax=Aspergillus stella-maris TaxID=1810926 RepID=UPI003CCD3E7B
MTAWVFFIPHATTCQSHNVPTTSILYTPTAHIYCEQLPIPNNNSIYYVQSTVDCCAQQPAEPLVGRNGAVLHNQSLVQLSLPCLRSRIAIRSLTSRRINCGVRNVANSRYTDGGWGVTVTASGSEDTARIRHVTVYARRLSTIEPTLQPPIVWLSIHTLR